MVTYHVCHKCGLPRKVVVHTQEPRKPVDLGQCSCLSQTNFEFEFKPRSLEEAVKIGCQRFLDYIALYDSQGTRTGYDYLNLAKKYKKVLKARKDMKRGDGK